MRSKQKKSAQSATPYVERLNRVFDHIFAHFSEPLRLNELAEIAELSPFHYYRVFQAMVGETPSEFIKRLKSKRSLKSEIKGVRAH